MRYLESQGRPSSGQLRPADYGGEEERGRKKKEFFFFVNDVFGIIFMGIKWDFFENKSFIKHIGLFNKTDN